MDLLENLLKSLTYHIKFRYNNIDLITKYSNKNIKWLRMEEKEIKRQMMTLWAKTFHDSSQYIDLIFEHYFNPEYIAYFEEKGEIVSSLLGIPYSFRNNGRELRGLYLCGLNTRPDYRNQGIMSKLIEDINFRAKEKGFAFTFLIPANEILINFYSYHKYYKAMYRIEDRYTDIHDFNNDYLSSILDEDERVRNLKTKYFQEAKCMFLEKNNTDLLEEVISFIIDSENKNHSFITLAHSHEDIKNVILENAISKGKTVVCKTSSGEISGVAFFIAEENKRILVQHVYYADSAAYYKILQFIKSAYSEYSMSVFLYPEQSSRKALDYKFYGGSTKIGDQYIGSYDTVERVYNVSAHAKLYGMIRPINMDEILKFLANDKRDAKFSILVKNKRDENNAILVAVKNGKANINLIVEQEEKLEIKKNAVTVLSEKELYEVLFRKPDQTSAIVDAFGIPRMIFNMTLLLD